LVASELTQDQLDAEEHMGWTIDQLEHAMRNIDVHGAALAMVDLEITAERGPTLIACSGAAAKGAAARCTEYDASGNASRHFTDRLLDEPALNAISVQRASAPVTTP
jgi:hypothetical protein